MSSLWHAPAVALECVDWVDEAQEMVRQIVDCESYPSSKSIHADDAFATVHQVQDCAKSIREK